MVAMHHASAERVKAAVRSVGDSTAARAHAAAVSGMLRAHPRSATQRAADWVEFAAAAGPQATSMQRPPTLQGRAGWCVVCIFVYFCVLLLPTLAALF